jgi:hypothetical protein
VCVGAAGLVALISAGGANASGPDLSGQTYATASKSITGWGWKAEIATVVGSQLATDDCLVTSSRKSTFLDSSGKSQGLVMLLDLNCNAPLAAPGRPGNSAASPAGQVVKKELGILAWFAKSPEENCGGIHAAYCKQLCEKYADSCTPELQDYVAQL